MRSTFSIVLLMAIAFVPSAQAKVSDELRLTAVGAPWWVVIDGTGHGVSNLATKADGSYFLLEPTTEGINFSLWIEPANKCKTSSECRDFVLNSGNPKWGKYERLNKAAFDRFEYFEFFRPKVNNEPLKMQDLYAQYVDSGYWLDVHLSKVQYQDSDKAKFEKLLKSLRFVSKSGKAADGDGVSIVLGVAQAWLADWDQKKCDQSYGSLTSISREAVQRQTWMDYCTSIHNDLGKLVSRELISIQTMASLPPRPDRSGSQMWFQSKFENGIGVEFVSLTTESNGKWTVSNYRPQMSR